jgi:hypothetical protein
MGFFISRTVMMSTRSIVADAARGAVTGVAAVAGGYLAYRLAEAYARGDSNNYTNSADAAGEFAIIFLACGLPFGLLAGYLSARLSRLPRPWLVSIIGLAVSSVLLCGAGGQGMTWRLPVMILIYVSVAVIVGTVPSRKASATARPLD